MLSSPKSPQCLWCDTYRATFPHTARNSGSQISVCLSPVLEETIFKRPRRSLQGAGRCPRLPINLTTVQRRGIPAGGLGFLFSNVPFNMFREVYQIDWLRLGACFLLNESRVELLQTIWSVEVILLSPRSAVNYRKEALSLPCSVSWEW